VLGHDQTQPPNIGQDEFATLASIVGKAERWQDPTIERHLKCSYEGIEVFTRKVQRPPVLIDNPHAAEPL
jgi:hypothetical protein